YFFFSSRRRHTRSKRDWSSDVCSSDLNSLLTRKKVFFLNAFSTVSATKKRRVIVFSPLFCFFTTGFLGMCNRCVPISFRLVRCKIGRASCRDSLLLNVGWCCVVGSVY